MISERWKVMRSIISLSLTLLLESRGLKMLLWRNVNVLEEDAPAVYTYGLTKKRTDAL